MQKFNGYVDCRIDRLLENDFLTLSLCGKPVFSYAVETLLSCDTVSKITVITDSLLIKKKTMELFGDSVSLSESFAVFTKPYVIISGRAPFIKSSTLDNAVNFRGGGIAIQQ